MAVANNYDLIVVTGQYDQYRLNASQVLGRGSKGATYLTRPLKNPRQQLIVKQIPVLDETKIQNAFEEIASVMHISSKNKAKNLVKIVDCCAVQDNVYVVMEYYPNGDLTAFLRNQPEQKLDSSLHRRLAVHLAVALFNLHSKNIKHLNLKPSNIFIGHKEDGSIEFNVSAFSLSRLTTHNSTAVTAPIYEAPEVIRDANSVDAKCDLWSIGMILFEAAVQVFDDDAKITLMSAIYGRNTRLNYFIEHEITDNEPLRDLLSRLLVVDVQERMSLEEFFSHEYIATKSFLKRTGKREKLKRMVSHFGYITEDHQFSWILTKENLDCEQFQIIDDFSSKNTQLKWRIKIKGHYLRDIDRQVIYCYLCNGPDEINMTVVDFSISLAHRGHDEEGYCTCEDNLSGPVNFGHVPFGHGLGFSLLYKREKFINTFVIEGQLTVNLTIRYLPPDAVSSPDYLLMLCRDFDLDENYELKSQSNESFD